MCNKIHKEPENKFKKIPKAGDGWKIFCLESYGLRAFCHADTFEADEDEWVNWKDSPINADGFCFFLGEPDMKALSFFNPYLFRSGVNLIILKKIKYRKGIGSFIETEDPSWPKGTRFAICKSFKVIE